MFNLFVVGKYEVATELVSNWAPQIDISKLTFEELLLIPTSKLPVELGIKVYEILVHSVVTFKFVEEPTPAPPP